MIAIESVSLVLFGVSETTLYDKKHAVAGQTAYLPSIVRVIECPDPPRRLPVWSVCLPVCLCVSGFVVM